MLTANEVERLESVVRPVYRPIREAILGAFRYYQTKYAEELHNHNPRTRACVVNDLMMVEFMKKSLKNLGIRVFKVQNRVLFDIWGQVLLHFKKLNRHLLSSNIQTEFAYCFANQLALPGIPAELPRLVAGYVPSPDWTAVQDVCITMPRGNNIEWSRSLLDKPELLRTTEDQPNEQPRRKFRKKGSGDRRDPTQGTGTDGG